MEVFTGRHLLTLQDYSGEELRLIFQAAGVMKELQKKGESFQPLQGKTLGMIFEKNSTRTRVSFEVAMYQLGGHALFLSGQDLQLARGETIADTARVLSRYLDAIMIRTFSHAQVEELAAGSAVPVINGLTDSFHPCQALADFFTILEKKGTLKGVKMAYVGDGNNNVTHSLLLGGAKLGVNIHVAVPRGYEPAAEVLRGAELAARESGSEIVVGTDPQEAVRGADVVYTDVWTSMGKEEEGKKRLGDLSPYQVNDTLLAHAKKDVTFLHCLPAHRGEEVTDQVMDGPSSVVFDQAENRLHTQKAVLVLLVGGEAAGKVLGLEG